MVHCLPCVVGYHNECWDPDSEGNCHCQKDAPVAYIGGDSYTAAETSDGETREKKEHGGQIKELANVKDLESTGRKRAAKLYPIPKKDEPGYPMSCEWQGLEFAGGGAVPIMGCMMGEAKNIHHGPDKNTLSNFVGNVHRICSNCHNRWHTINDQYYPTQRPPGNIPFTPLDRYENHKHNGVAYATPQQLATSEVAWAGGTAGSFFADRLVVVETENEPDSNSLIDLTE